MPRRARLDAPGTLHHVILRGINKRRIVDDIADRKNFVKRMGELASGTKTTIYAWALMTNHRPWGRTAMGSPIKGRVKKKNTSPQEKTCRFFSDTLAVLDSVYSCCLFCFAPVISVYGSRGL